MDFIDDLIYICDQYHSDSFYVGASIPDKKFNNVVTEFPIPNGEEIIAVLDVTVFGSCKNGLAICREGLYVNNDWTARMRKGFVTWEQFKYADLNKFSHYEIEVTPSLTVNVAGSSMKAKQLLEILEHIQAYLLDQDSGEYEEEYEEAYSAPPVPGNKDQNEQWMLAIDGQQYGPYTSQMVMDMIRNGQINREVTYVWKQGMAQWELLNSIAEFTPNTPPMPPPAPPVPKAAPQTSRQSEAFASVGNSVEDSFEEVRVIELNSASMEDLISLPGINIHIAQVFIEERVRKNGFGSYSEIREILNLQPHIFEKIRERTTLKPLAKIGNSGRMIDF